MEPCYQPLNGLMTILDISWPLISGMTTYKNKDDFVVYPAKEWDKDQVRESRIVCGAHTGTHIDAPAHFLQDGVCTDSINLEKMCGPCVVLDLVHVAEAITADDLALCDITSSRVLLKTRNSQLAAIDPFDPHFVYLAQSGALYLRDKGVICVGIDYLGIERNQPDHTTHILLLEHGIALIEGLRLAHINQGNYTLICLPLALVGVEAAPARAVLLPA